MHDAFGNRRGILATYACDHCDWWNLALYEGAGDPPNERLAEWMHAMSDHLKWLPMAAVGKQYEDVPQHIASTASEAHVCASVKAYRAAVQLARSVVEATAKDKDITTGRLVEKIDSMHAQGLIREHVKDAAHEIRHLGNEMAHGDFVEAVSPEEADEVLELMSEVLNEVYQSPARVERRRQARLARKQSDGVEAEGTPP